MYKKMKSSCAFIAWLIITPLVCWLTADGVANEDSSVYIPMFCFAAVLIGFPLQYLMQLGREAKEDERVIHHEKLRQQVRHEAVKSNPEPNQLEITNRALGQALKMLKESGKTDDELKSLIKVYRQNRQ